MKRRKKHKPSIMFLSVARGNDKNAIIDITLLYVHVRVCFGSTWNFPPLAQVLASTANYMICDDHEVVDDLGELGVLFYR